MPLDEHKEGGKQMVLQLKQNWNPRDERWNPHYWPGSNQNLTSLTTSSSKGFLSKFWTTEVLPFLCTTLVQSLSSVNTFNLLSNLLKKKKIFNLIAKWKNFQCSGKKKKAEVLFTLLFQIVWIHGGAFKHTSLYDGSMNMCRFCLHFVFTCSRTAQTNRTGKQKEIYCYSPCLWHHRDL